MSISIIVMTFFWVLLGVIIISYSFATLFYLYVITGELYMSTFSIWLAVEKRNHISI